MPDITSKAPQGENTQGGMTYRTIRETARGEVVEKKSRFIGELFPVTEESEAETILAGIRKKYYDARHHCPAYIIGVQEEKGTGDDLRLVRTEVKRFSDDGEPSQTAGRPMMDVLEGAGLSDCLLVVTRYFGGTLLGTGGLVRAYSEAARLAVEDALSRDIIVTYTLCDLVAVKTDYTDLGKINRLLEKFGGKQLQTDYGADVVLHIAVPASVTPVLQKELREATAARAGWTPEGMKYLEMK